MIDVRERLQQTVSRVTERGIAWTAARTAARRPYSADNRYLEGPFAPVASETTAFDLRVEGELPKELNGTFTRIGPNPLSVPNPGSYHWFLGDGLVHGLRLAEGRALWYRSRFVGTDTVNAALGRPRVPGARRGVSSVVNTNAIGHAGRMWAIVEGGGFPVELDAELESVRHGLFDSDVSLPFSAHPHLDPKTGTMHAICYDGITTDKVYHVAIDARGALERSVAIAVQDGPMMHDCAITGENVLIFDLPVTQSKRALMQGIPFPYRWNTSHAARVGLLPKNGDASAVRWFSIDPCYVFHSGNAYDLPDGGAVVDVVVHDTMFAKETDGPDSEKITFERWTLDAPSGTVKRTVRNDASQEFPRYDERLTGQPNRYTYTISLRGDNSDLIRTDNLSGDIVTRPFGAGRVPNEVVFVPRGAAEDDGWLMSYVWNAATDKTDIIILDATDLQAEPQAVVSLPVRVPVGFHGNWVPAS